VGYTKEMTVEQQKIWEKAARRAIGETNKFNEGKLDDLFYRVAIDYYTKMLLEQVKKSTK
jgi:hypothetical protein